MLTDSDTRAVPTKEMDITLHPSQSMSLIQNTSVNHTVPEDLVAGQETKGAELDRDQYKSLIATCSEILSSLTRY